MHPNPFTLSLSSGIQVNPSENGYTLGLTASTGEGLIAAGLTVPALPGVENAIAHLREGTATLQQLTQTLSAREGAAVGEQLAATLQALGDRGWLQYGVLPLAIAEPMADSATLDLDIPHWSQAQVSLSRFAYQRSHGGGMVLESPLSKFRIKLTDWRASAILAQLAQPQPLRRLTPPPQIGPETAYQFLNLLWATGFLSLEAAEAPELQLWEFHNLLFHSRSRQGRHDYPAADIAASLDIWDQFPVVKPPLGGAIVPLPQFSIDAIRQRDKTLTTALEKRQSMREYDDHRPITVEQLGEFLYRTARVKEVYSLEAEQQALIKAEFGEAFDWGELSRRPYPCGGAMYELEIYPVVRHCAGVNPGLYHYDPLNHHLVQLDTTEADLQALLQDAHQSSGAQGMPQVLLIITARFGRLFRKYRSLAYALVLKHVGVLYENFYLVATAMDLAPCALGAGDSDRFAQATGLDYVVESSVGEFMLGSLPSAEVKPSQPVNAEEADGTPDDPVAASDPVIAEVEPTVSPSSPPPLPPLSLALHPHDLDDRIPGLADLRNHTLGDPRITIVILDGNPDHSLSCFDGAEISKVFPYWHPPAEPVPQEAYLKFQEIDNDDTLDKDQKAEAQKAAFPDALLRRIHGDNHACHITSTIVGQENTPSPGLAPRCRVINVPLNTTSDNEEFISPLNLARAFELALDLGANIIHCAACRPTQTGEGEELLLQALKKCLDHNILIVAPAGNNEGECWCMPATLPGVLSVGALKPDGKPYKFSNWGGNNALEGIMAPGGEILGAQPANEAPVRLKGTSMAAPVMTGLCSLLMSRQLQQGKPLDAEAIRAALLTTALPCTPDDTDEPERCLRGKVNLPGAMEILFGPSVTISFTGDQVTRQDYGAIAPSVVSSQPSVGSSEAVENLAAPSSPPPVSPAPPLPITPSSSITPSTAHSGHVYALGTIAYDFGDEARRDTFRQAMAAVNRDGVLLPPDPYDPRQIVDHLDHHPDQAPDLIWTLQLDGNTLYALDPKGPFAPATYEMFLLMLNGQLAPPTSGEFIDHISLPGKRTDRTVVLLSGEEVPVLKVLNPRGMYGWNVPTLVEAALATVTPPEGETTLLREGLTAFLQRVYHDLRNVGQTSRDRALNFAVTNTFQAAATFAEAIADRRQLDTIEVEKSPYCRMNSDCWDVLLTFYDPEDGKRSRQVFRFTLDVADTMPVTVGRIKRWAKPGKGGQAAVDH